MSMRIFDRTGVAGLCGLLLAGCGGGGPDSDNGTASPASAKAAAQADADDGRADCAIGPGGRWARQCRVERAAALLTIRHPDGGFRRFRIVPDGRGLMPADGAEAATVRVIAANRIELSVGQDRYLLPVTLASPAR